MESFIISATITFFYGLLHELIHYTTARFTGCNARLILVTKCLIPSIGLDIRGQCSKHSGLILYSPYILNMAMIGFGLLSLWKESIVSRLLFVIGLVTLPNMFLEEEERREKLAQLFLRV